MAPHVVAQGLDEHTISPVLSSATTFVSVGSIPSSIPERSPGVQEAFSAAASRTMSMGSTVIELSGGGTPTNMHLEADVSFTRHRKYFFPDGNVTFLVSGMLYCVHRYFFSRDSTHFSTQFDQLDIRDHEAFHTIISLRDTERKDFDALLSVIYPENFEEHHLSYEEWKSVLHLSTRWGFASIRKLTLSTINPPTPHDQLLLARTHSVDHWVVPALSALCERTAPLTLSEARQMDIEDVVLVATVRENIRSHALQVDAAEIVRHVEAAQAGKLAGREGFTVPPSTSKKGTTKQALLLENPKPTAKEEAERSELLAGRVSTLAVEQPRPVEDMRQGRHSPEDVSAMCAAEAESAAAREAELVAARDAEPREAEAEALAARREAEATAVREAQTTAARRQRVQGIEGVLLQKFGLAPGMWSR